MPGFLRKEPTIEELENLSEVEDAKLTVAERQALRRKVEQMYGKDGSKGLFKNIRSGIAWDEIKFKLGNPRFRNPSQ